MLLQEGACIIYIVYVSFFENLPFFSLFVVELFVTFCSGQEIDMMMRLYPYWVDWLPWWPHLYLALSDHVPWFIFIAILAPRVTRSLGFRLNCSHASLIQTVASFEWSFSTLDTIIPPLSLMFNFFISFTPCVMVMYFSPCT